MLAYFSHRVRSLTASSSFQGRIQGLKAMNVLTDPETNSQSAEEAENQNFVSEIFLSAT